MEFTHGRMGDDMRETTIPTRNRAKALILTQMGVSIRESGTKVSSTVSAL